MKEAMFERREATGTEKGGRDMKNPSKKGRPPLIAPHAIVKWRDPP
jgi:hypothetical protein